MSFANRVTICILNYNGAVDTLDCIKSLIEYEPILNWQILVYDNRSSDEDRQTLWDGLASLGITFRVINAGDEGPDVFDANVNERCLLFLGDKNLGFARANNWLVCYAMRGLSDRYVLLNNDTIFIQPSLTKLLDAFDNPSTPCDYATTDIHYYASPDTSWNAGGSIGFGTRRYNLDAEIERFLRRGEHFPQVQFITGCFFLLSRVTVEKMGLLTEDFFFGEEDYEFALRARSIGAVGRVLLDTYILHKVGASIGRGRPDASISRAFIHRLNRLIDMRRHYGRLQWLIWSRLSCLYFRHDLERDYKLCASEAKTFSLNLLSLSSILDGVSKLLFEQLIRQDNSFFTTRFTSEQLDELVSDNCCNSGAS